MNPNEKSGILLIDKEPGWTSNDICQVVKGRFRFKKVGHGGTLDPFASGLMVLFINKATKISSQSLCDEKEYEGTIHLGLTTSTGDPDGDVLAENCVEHLSEEEIVNKMKSFIGEQWQKPPMTSAIKVNGTPLYRLARKGKEVDRDSRKISILSMEILKVDLPFVQFRAKVSKGTYIRVLAEDIGKALNVGASLNVLRRISSGAYSVEKSLPIQHVKAKNINIELDNYLIQATMEDSYVGS